MDKPKVLIVEDESIVSKIIEKELNNLGYEVLKVLHSGEEAVEFVIKNKPDIILMDIVLGNNGISGIEAAEEINKKMKIPIIYLTAHAEEIILKKAKVTEPYGYILKPFKERDLNIAIKIALYKFRMEEERKKLIEELMEKNKILEEMVIRDSLTNLYNHKYIYDVLDREVKRAKRYNMPLTVAMFDIDHFKRINDIYGHLYGDEVLKAIAKIIKESVREVDVAGRCGGEEFVIILPETNKGNGILVAERIRRKIENLKWEYEDLVITISGGVETYTKQNTVDVINAADFFLYKSKNNGRNQIYTE